MSPPRSVGEGEPLTVLGDEGDPALANAHLGLVGVGPSESKARLARIARVVAANEVEGDAGTRQREVRARADPCPRRAVDRIGLLPRRIRTVGAGASSVGLSVGDRGTVVADRRQGSAGTGQRTAGPRRPAAGLSSAEDGGDHVSEGAADARAGGDEDGHHRGDDGKHADPFRARLPALSSPAPNVTATFQWELHAFRLTSDGAPQQGPGAQTGVWADPFLG
jgi:hypothetical protein